jgi:aryl-alcohol dehydrogenase-like predicted oxidoreductase
VLPIPGTLSIDHARDNLAALELDLGDADDIAALGAALLQKIVTPATSGRA